MRRFSLLTLCLAIFLIIYAKGDIMASEDTQLADGLYAKFVTDKGDIITSLEFEKTPLTVTNFVGLAEGTKDSTLGKNVKFYDGLTFHRVIDNFMIQGGCPLGSGTGGPGYTFPDEIDPTLKHDGPGRLSMANAGPGTNGSQFFITHVATPWLDGKHTVFGHVVSVQEVVNAIKTGDTIKTIEIIRVGDAAEAFKADQAAFDTLIAGRQEAAAEKAQEKMQAQNELIEKKWPNAKTTPSGMRYIVLQEGSGETPTRGTTVTAHYTGTLLDGKKFDSSVDRGKPFQFPVGAGRVIKGWDEAFLSMKKGEKRIIILPPNLAYGARGAGGVIPPNATLVFEVELLDF
jgi:FKBP-type peptidyl-prolyl cis-trans isomerase